MSELITVLNQEIPQYLLAPELLNYYTARKNLDPFWYRCVTGCGFGQKNVTLLVRTSIWEWFHCSAASACS
jgi:hypothetical protein